jgi:hypothetical protein
VLQTPRASAARSVAGRPAMKTNGRANAVIRGTRSTPEAYAQPASISELKRSASPVQSGQLIRTGMRRNESAGMMDSKKAVIR